MASKIRRNDPCPCGSGKKYKKCCMNKGIFESLGSLPTEQEEQDYSEFDSMPCTVLMSAISGNVSQNDLVARKLKRNNALLRNGEQPAEEEKTDLIDAVEKIFLTYDKIQLLGALGLHFIYVNAFRSDIFTDEDIEPILEYALSFAYASSENSTTSPTDDVIKDLYAKLLRLKQWYNDTELFESIKSKNSVRLLYHSAYMNVRGDGYSKYLEEVYNEYFSLHKDFIANHYCGATLEDIQILVQHIENRILTRLGDPSGRGVLGAYMLWEQWKKWDDENRKVDPKTGFTVFNNNHPNPIMGDFLEANPELPQTEDGKCLIYQCNCYEDSEAIFSIIPRNERDRALLDALSCELGDNHEFMEGDYRGSILSYATIVRQKPFLKYNGKYYCFSILLAHRRMFEITASLFNIDEDYYNYHIHGNEFPECRDNYTERKVYELLSRKFPEVKFYPSYHCRGIAGEKDLLGTSPNATYLIEVKADQLTDRYRGGVGMLEKKLKESVGKGSKQSWQAKEYIQNTKTPIFTCHGESNIRVNKDVPIFRICVTLEHYGTLTCNIKELVSIGVIEDNQRDIWIVSLYDLMAILEKISDEKSLIEYLTLHNKISNRNDVFCNDELDVFGAFLLNPEILQTPPSVIMGYSSILDKMNYGITL